MGRYSSTLAGDGFLGATPGQQAGNRRKLELLAGFPRASDAARTGAERDGDPSWVAVAGSTPALTPADARVAWLASSEARTAAEASNGVPADTAPWGTPTCTAGGFRPDPVPGACHRGRHQHGNGRVRPAYAQHGAVCAYKSVTTMGGPSTCRQSDGARLPDVYPTITGGCNSLNASARAARGLLDVYSASMRRVKHGSAIARA